MRLWGALTLALAVATASVWGWAGDAGANDTYRIGGKTVFLAKGCVGCHQRGSMGQVQIGPNLTDLGERATEEYVRQSITDPRAHVVSGYEGVEMPSLSLTDSELDALVDFLLEPEPDS